jgi:hypothetical protein
VTDIVEIIGRGGKLSQQVSDALMALIREGGQLGELEEHTVHIPGEEEPRAVKRVPESWLRRLEKAVDVGAFAKRGPDYVVQTILTTPEAN